MFGFKAYFWDDKVCIDDQVYKSNEILTAYLNLDCSELDSYLIHPATTNAKPIPSGFRITEPTRRTTLAT